MTPRLETVEEIFHAAVECDPDKLGAFLDEKCAADGALRGKVEELLAAHRQAESFIETPVATLATSIFEDGESDLLIGETIGHYKIVKRISAGGMGAVYLAGRADQQYEKQVAIKLIKRGMDTDSVLRHFRNERQILASFDHPNIARLLDGGATHDGLPYFVMEYVEGLPIDQYCQNHALSIAERLKLFREVCAAVTYAHRHTVIHRDIKPSNILVTNDGTPKLLDFGVAKILQPGDGAEALATITGFRLMTPEYASPEQVRGEPVSAATDVYSLGVVLYQLLTGQKPYRLKTRTPEELSRAILEQQPPRPSTAIARSDGSSKSQVPNPKLLRGDLDNIVLLALRKEPERRYQSVEQFSEDIRRHLEAQPVVARKDTVAYRTTKFVRRNPTLTAGATACLLLALTVTWLLREQFSAASKSPPPRKSIAVLPFQNLSKEPESAYFADGIQDEILTRLAKIADLKVISRNSTQRYQSKPGNLAEIAKQLGVANILEGSIQKAVDQVRVNVQLVNAQTDSHLWAETYDRKLTDIFSVESEIAKRIAESLQAKLTGREEQALTLKPTNNPEAYDAYLRAVAFQSRIGNLNELFTRAMSFYERAVQLDPNFAIAWARLSRLNAWFYFNRFDATTAGRENAAKNALENAQKLEPNSPETLLALGYYQYWVLLDYAPAKSTFEHVSKLLPGSSEARIALGLIARRVGQWDQSIAYFEQALTLDPHNVELLNLAAATYAMLREFPTALKLRDRALDITPNDPEVMACKAGVYQAQGNLQEAARLLPEKDPQTPNGYAFYIKIKQLRLERNYSEAIRLLQAKLAQFHYHSDFIRADDQLALALMQRLAGDTAGARVTAEQARDTLEQLYRNQTDRAPLAATLALAYAVMGQKDSALKLAEGAIILRSTSSPPGGSGFEENRALIQTIIGENNRAISTLRQVLQTPCSNWHYATPVTPALLTLDPIWDPLRADLAFQKLCEGKLD